VVACLIVHFRAYHISMQPLTTTETVLAKLWCQLLGVSQVQPADNFFDLGGHSLLATQLTLQLRKAFQSATSSPSSTQQQQSSRRVIPMTFLFQYPTMGGLAAAIDALMNNNSFAETKEEKAPPGALVLM